MYVAERPDYDQALKAILREAHDGLLALIAPDVRWRGELSPELVATKRQVDLIWDVTLPNGDLGILHIELQTKIEADIGGRLAAYGYRLWEEYHRQLRSIVIFLRPARSVPTPPFMIEWMGRPTSWYDYDVIRLWELPRELVLRTSYVDLWPLAVLMKDTSIEAAQTVAAQIAAADLPRHKRGELTGLLILLSGLRLRTSDLEALVRSNLMLEELLKESTFAEAFRNLYHDELTAEGREEGLAEGREEGLAEGRAEQARAAIKTVLTARFGALDAALIAAIDQLDQRDPATLNDLLAACATEPLERIRERLGVA
jgi:predicted transposase YdaD